MDEFTAAELAITRWCLTKPSSSRDLPEGWIARRCHGYNYFNSKGWESRRFSPTDTRCSCKKNKPNPGAAVGCHVQTLLQSSELYVWIFFSMMRSGHRWEMRDALDLYVVNGTSGAEAGCISPLLLLFVCCPVSSNFRWKGDKSLEDAVWMFYNSWVTL